MVWPNRAAFGACLVAALVSDYFDGVIARRLGIATPNLRRLDSVADSVFYVSALFAAWYLHAELILAYKAGLFILIALEIGRYVFDYWKFGKEASYHMWSSKFWGLALFFGFFSVLALGEGGWPVALAIFAGVMADLEGLSISLLLRSWKNDVPTVFHAWQLRRSGA